MRSFLKLSLFGVAVAVGLSAGHGADPKPDRSPHGAAVELVLKEKADDIRKLEKVEKDEWWHDVKERSWVVRRPFHPGVIDTTHSFDVSYLIDGRIVGRWGVDTRTGKVVAWAEPATEAPKHTLFKGCNADAQIPPELVSAYERFVRLAAQGEPEGACLPRAVTITKQPRQGNMTEYGQDMNLPFLKDGFSADVQTVRKDADDTFLLRTGTSAVWFVQTKSGSWKIFRYLDKPIE
jgi:hypothetical protein